MKPRYRTVALLITGGLSCCLMTSRACGQLQFSEVMYNSVDEGSWEWVEVRNMTGSPVDLNGYIFDDDDNNALNAANIVAMSSGGMATNTMIPASSVAVLYNGTALGFNDQRFRNAWQLSASVPLIAVASPPSLSNTGDAFGLWSNLTTYGMDLDDIDMDGNFEVVQFTNAAASLDYTMGFPSATDASIYWNGTGVYNDGGNWLRSMDGVAGATTSIPTFLSGGTQINNTNDVANPGLLPAGALPAGLHVTEIMFNPASSEPNWEWFEVLNNTGGAIDFAATPFTFDDASSGQLTVENITSGVLPNGEVGIFYNADRLTLQNAQDAWGAGLNYVPVSEWSPLNNSGGDTVALWDNFAQYLADKTAGTTTHARAAVAYEVNPANGWPADDGNGSIYLSAPNADPTQGTNWLLSASGDLLSRNASPALQNSVPDHTGGDIGSPGLFGAPPAIDGDFDDDGDYDCDDVNALVADIAAGNNSAGFDLTGDGSVNLDDRDAWLAEAGANNLVSGRPYLLGDANLDGDVDGSDFGAWNGNKFTSTAAWCAGDFDANGGIDGSDFGIWNGNKFTSANATAAVPEPERLVAVDGNAAVAHANPPQMIRQRSGDTTWSIRFPTAAIPSIFTSS